MRYSVGFQLYENGEEPFSEIVKAYRDSISEVFFAWQDIATGRSTVATRHGYTDWSAQRRTEEELLKIKALGVKLDLLFNGNCYGEYAISEKLANTVISVLDHLDGIGCGADIITTASPAIAHTVKKNFPNIEVRASVNMRIGTVKGMEYLSDLFDSFHVQRDYNRNIPHLLELKKWADAHGKKLVMLANSGCFRDCSGQSFHDNLVAHESEICEVRNLNDFTPYVCWRALENRENWHMLLENTWVRPEDIHNYHGIFDTVKLATRMHSLPGLVIDAYARQKFFGNTLDLFEPGFGRAIAPYIISNGDFPKDWFTKTASCDKMCYRCGYCKSVLESVMINTEENE
jgi:collagenase-like PrtC family protease